MTELEQSKANALLAQEEAASLVETLTINLETATAQLEAAKAEALAAEAESQARVDALTVQVESLSKDLETAKASALQAEAEAAANAETMTAQVKSLTSQLENTLAEKAAAQIESQAAVDALNSQISDLNAELAGIKADFESKQIEHAAAITNLEEKLAESELSRINVQSRVLDAGTNEVYWKNTVCTFGLHLRDILPKLTDKWYTVTPIDLSLEGSQSFELVAGNMWIIGRVTVTVEGDRVLIDRDIFHKEKGKTKIIAEYLNIFGDLNSITPEALEQTGLYGGGYQFGQPVSIKNDLGGDTNVLLYVRSIATYRPRVSEDQFLTRMWKNLPHRVAQRNAMLALMDPLKEEASSLQSN